MFINIDYSHVEDITPAIEGDDIYTLTIHFDNGEVAVYGYTDNKEMLKDYNSLLNHIGE